MTEREIAPESYSRFPRTAGEAFKDASYSDPIERPEPGYGLAWWLGVGVIAAVGAVLIWLSR